ncbi:DAK2 domain-containing protein [Lactobacillus acetotolerans]|uniref:DAK2 domain-containing protein n=2 Tax=Lactobacillus acetotolerans TaxID=1600 RepID=A0A5P5ZI77_9LACO|nr:DAK2 domain-containing protein [Lactobacillus acetotolerans]KRN41916.1 Dihydroacetone kinase [Lactobacillus acetotolerans DSM 20749 = JCM 3825]MBN7275919.1 DAK2 domain-containing protein [Lactobacillus acetotolerans]QFG51113.1 DAK2 domain-containing protein [Lactobacillus acetotolerans]QGV04781.1 DAK2 domain-containing protein [Lactobacillus acetotolerans]QJD73421.1 DAK2 domain-containing protein [Lactobacillus acetotolerans]
MVLKEIDSKKFRDMVRVATHRIGKNAKFVNSLNVFPVPDGDTGTNMNLTIESGAKAVAENPSSKVGDLTESLSKGMLMGARGNSGVISSQLFRGFYKATQGMNTLTAQELANGFTNGVATAYKAVMKPVEGTILTVARVAAQDGANKANESDDVEEVMKAVVEGAKKALKSTPDLLPVLKQVGVVDSGGQGLLFIYEGFLEGLLGENFADQYQPDETEMDEMINAMHHQSVQSQLATQDIKNGYCTEIMVDLTADIPNKKPFNLDEFRKHLSGLGDSLLAVSDDEVAKVHVHTEHPGEVFQYGSQFGQLEKIKIDNMRIQHETIVNNNEEKQKSVDFAVIAVASGNGIRKLFESEGVNRIISGGQTMNPSTQDIADAIKKSGAKKAIVLPNNGNIVLAAKQAAEVSDIPVGIVPSKTISQGLTSMLSFNPDDSVEDNVKNMTEDLDTVVSGQVTQANRDTTIDKVEVHKNDYLGIVDGNIRVDDPDMIKATTKMIEKMLNEDSEIITIMFGRDASKKDADKVVADLKKKHDDLEFEIHDGGQPVYHFLISVE